MKGLNYLLLISMTFLSSCVKNESPTDTTPPPTSTPVTITTSWNGTTSITSGPPSSNTIAEGTTAYFDLSAYARVEVSWIAGFDPYPHSNSTVTYETRLYGGKSGSIPTTLYFKKPTKSVDTYTVTLQAYQLVGSELYRFVIRAQPVVAPADSFSVVYTLSNLKILGYTE
ncbi:MAG: hypothetical protein COW08_08830 [Ignavibacteriales bacterium CG12_big_fil_rev_8_21_14_0_65_30_8]|nr:MAG: hypothetical protein COW08_08830 [Ignavibacteriales bacterium CG12_big_fil_rev_8_21_14_0_65_30_8]